MKVADYIIDFFAQKGIDKAFVVYGAANGDLIDAFTRNNKIQYIIRNEVVKLFEKEKLFLDIKPLNILIIVKHHIE